MKDPAPQTGWQIVCRVQALHPEWTVSEHVAYLRDHEGQDIDPIWVGHAGLRNIARGPAGLIPRRGRRPSTGSRDQTR